MIRDMTADEVNTIANHPDVYEMLLLGALHPQCAMDYEETLDSPLVTTLGIDGFAAIFQWTSPGTYEVHVMALPQVRGGEMMAASHKIIAEMKRRGAKRLWGQPSRYNRPAQVFVRRMGLSYKGEGHHPIVGDVQYYELEL